MSTTSTPVSGKPATPSPPPAAADEFISPDDWIQSSYHRVWLHNGGRILISIPDLIDLVVQDALPAHLRETAMKVTQRQIDATLDEPTPEQPERSTDEMWTDIKQAAELFDHLAYSMVKKPELTVEQFKRLPTEDRDMLRDIALRQRHTDAKGVLLGVAPLSAFDSFPSRHRCPPGCEACRAALDDVSSRSPL